MKLNRRELMAAAVGSAACAALPAVTQSAFDSSQFQFSYRRIASGFRVVVRHQLARGMCFTEVSSSMYDMSDVDTIALYRLMKPQLMMASESCARWLWDNGVGRLAILGELGSLSYSQPVFDNGRALPF